MHLFDVLTMAVLGTRRPGAVDRWRWLVLGLAWAAQAVGAAVFLGLPVLGPALQSDYGLDLRALGAAFAALMLGAGLSVVGWGVLADRVGERLVLVTGLTGAAVSLAVLATAPPVGLVVVLLALVGAGSASANAAGSRAVVTWFGPQERGLAMGIRQTALPVGAAAAALVLPAVAAARSVSVAVASLAGACLAAAVVARVAFPGPGAAVAPPTSAATRPRRSNTGLRRLLTASVLLAVPQLSVSSLLVVFLHDEHGWSSGRAGVLLAGIQLAGAAARPLIGRWSDMSGDRLRLMGRLAVVQAVALLGLGLAATGGGAALSLVVFLTGLITLSWNGLAAVAAGELAAPGRTGVTLGWQTSSVFVGGTIGAPLVAALAAATSWAVALGALSVPAAAAAVLLRQRRPAASPSMERLLARAFNEMSSAISLIDVLTPGQPVVHVNAAFRRLTGYEADQAIGRPWTIVEGPQTDPATAAQLREAIADGREVRVRIRHHRTDGRTYWSETYLSPVSDAAGLITHYLAVQKDVTAQTQAEQRAARLAYHDELTGLPNRTQLLEHLEVAVQHAAAQRTGVAVLFLDLDEFKPANDRYGHEIGDQLLDEVGQRWSTVTRPLDMLARYGGDEFVLLMTDLPAAEAGAAAAAAAERCAAALRHPFTLATGAEVLITLGVSVGVAHYPADGHTGSELLIAADAAMYEVKRTRRLRCVPGQATPLARRPDLEAAGGQ